MTHLSLFSGIGGIDLAAHWAGFRTVAFVERDEFCQKVLRKNFPGVPIYDDVTTFDGGVFRGRASLVTGGFPCQDISCANKNGKGLDGARSGLWFSMLGIIEQVEPAFVVAENVARLMRMGIDVCISGLERAGYTVWPVSVPAAGVGAWHRRQRIFLVGANADRLGMLKGGRATEREQGVHRERIGVSPVEEQAGVNVLCRPGPDATRVRGTTSGQEQDATFSDAPSQLVRVAPGFGKRSRLFEPKLCGDIHGVPNGLDRLRALGNAVVPPTGLPDFESDSRRDKSTRID